MNIKSCLSLLILLVVFHSTASARPKFERGLEFLKSGDYSKAAQEFQALVRKNPNYADGYHLLGLCFLKSGRLADAEKNILTAIKLNDDNFVFHYNLANTYASMRKPDKVIKTLNVAELLAPANQRYLVSKVRSQAYIALKQWPEAIPDLEAALAAKPDAAMQTQLGQAYFKAGESNKAATALKKAVSAKPDPAVHALLVEAMIEVAAKTSGNRAKKTAFDQALAEAMTFKSAAPSSFDAVYLVGRTALGAGEYDQAIGAFNTAIDKQPGNCNVKTNLGNAYAGKADWTNAISTLKDATKCDPRSSIAWRSMGFACQMSATESKSETAKQKFYTDAIAAYQKAAELSPSSSPSSSLSAAIASCEHYLEISRASRHTEMNPASQGMVIPDSAFVSTEGYGDALWGMSPDEVKAVYADARDVTDMGLLREGSIAGKSAVTLFHFTGDMLSVVLISFTDTYVNDNNYLGDYQELQALLTKKYGPPDSDDAFWSTDLYKNDPDQYGLAVAAGHLQLSTAWETKKTSIELSCTGENFEVARIIRYSSKELAFAQQREAEAKKLEGL